MAVLFTLINFAFSIYYILIIVYVLLSWLPQLRHSAIGIVLGKIVEPYLSVFRRFIPPLGVIDISPMVALLALYFMQRGLYFLIGLLLNPGQILQMLGS